MPLELADALPHGTFTTALIIPAVASTLKQAQREACDDLHILAGYYRTAGYRAGTALPALDHRTRRAAEHFGKVLIEQSINGTTFFLAVQVAASTAGALGGMLAQVGITGNTIVTPQQIQKFNPAKAVFGCMGGEPDWFSGLPEPSLRSFAFASGKFADWCGYGDASAPRADGNPRLTFRFA